ncbi:MAG: MATE family efflux transporter [Hyphomicrobiales bacterium]
MLTAYMIDGFAYAAEALVGQAIGAQWREGFHRAIRLTTLWAFVLGGALCARFLVFAGPLTRLMTVNPESSGPGPRHHALGRTLNPSRHSLLPVGWYLHGRARLITHAQHDDPLAHDPLAAWFVLEPAFGNAGLWAALNVFFLARGVTFASRLPAIERRVFAQRRVTNRLPPPLPPFPSPAPTPSPLCRAGSRWAQRVSQVCPMGS